MKRRKDVIIKGRHRSLKFAVYNRKPTFQMSHNRYETIRSRKNYFHLLYINVDKDFARESTLILRSPDRTTTTFKTTQKSYTVCWKQEFVLRINYATFHFSRQQSMLRGL